MNNAATIINVIIATIIRHALAGSAVVRYAQITCDEHPYTEDRIMAPEDALRACEASEGEWRICALLDADCRKVGVVVGLDGIVESHKLVPVERAIDICSGGWAVVGFEAF